MSGEQDKSDGVSAEIIAKLRAELEAERARKVPILNPFNGTLSLLLHPSTLSLIFWIVCLLLLFIIFLLYFVQSTLIGLGDGALSAVAATLSGVCSPITGALSWLAATANSTLFAQPPSQLERDPVAVSPLIPWVDTWIYGVEVGQFHGIQLQHVVDYSSENIVDMDDVEKARELSKQYDKELSAALANTHLPVQQLIQEIETARLSALCWGPPEERANVPWYNCYLKYSISNCRHMLAGQLMTLHEALQVAIVSRDQFMGNVKCLRSDKISKITVKVCRRRDQLRTGYRKFSEKLTEVGSDRGDVGVYLSSIGSVASFDDVMCRMIQFDHDTMQDKIKFMEDEKSFLTVSLEKIREKVHRADKVASREEAKTVEDLILEIARSWLKMMERYYEED